MDLSRFIFIVSEITKTKRLLRLGDGKRFYRGIRRQPSPEEMAARGIFEHYVDETDYFFNPAAGEYELLVLRFPEFPSSLEDLNKKSAAARLVKNRGAAVAAVSTLATAVLPGRITNLFQSLPAVVGNIDHRGVTATISPKLSPTPVAFWR